MSLHDSKQVPSWMEVHHQVEALWILGEGGGGVVRETPFHHSIILATRVSTVSFPGQSHWRKHLGTKILPPLLPQQSLTVKTRLG